MWGGRPRVSGCAALGVSPACLLPHPVSHCPSPCAWRRPPFSSCFAPVSVWVPLSKAAVCCVRVPVCSVWSWGVSVGALPPTWSPGPLGWPARPSRGPAVGFCGQEKPLSWGSLPPRARGAVLREAVGGRRQPSSLQLWSGSLGTLPRPGATGHVGLCQFSLSTVSRASGSETRGAGTFPQEIGRWGALGRASRPRVCAGRDSKAGWGVAQSWSPSKVLEAETIPPSSSFPGQSLQVVWGGPCAGLRSPGRGARGSPSSAVVGLWLT